MNDSPMLDWALKYAALSVRVVPGAEIVDGHCACPKPECNAGHPHGLLVPHAVHDGTMDPAVIREWWTRIPMANVGLAVADHWLVVDVDPRNGGADSFAQLLKQTGPLPDTVQVLSGGGGTHWYFTLPRGTPKLRQPKQRFPGIDLLQAGHYVRVPPSGHLSGNPYRFVEDHSFWDRDIAPAPESLIRCLQASDTTRGAEPPLHVVKAPPLSAAQIPTGERNTTLTSIAGTLRRNGANEERIAAALTTINQTNLAEPLPEEEVLAVARSVSKYPPARDYSEVGNARRLVDCYGENFRRVDKEWRIWNGSYWAVDQTHRMLQYAGQTVDRMRAGIDPWQPDKALVAAVARASQLTHQKHMIELAAAQPGIALPPEAFDTHPMLLNLVNGTLNLETGQLQNFRREDYLTSSLKQTYDPAAECPRWHEFLAWMTEGDADLQAYLQVVIGYALMGDPREQVIFFLLGSGANGKSTFLETLRKLFAHYAGTMPMEYFNDKYQPQIQNDVAHIRGKRFVTAMETDRSVTFSAARIKGLTGEDEVAARALFANLHEFRPTWVFFVPVNHAPRFSEEGTAIERRAKVIPCRAHIADEDRDTRLQERLRAELPGILAWAVEGLHRYQAEGRLPDCAAVVDASQRMWRTEDPAQAAVQLFIRDRCVRAPGVTISYPQLYMAYQAFCQERALSALTEQQFNAAVKAHDVTSVRRAQGNVWLNITVDDGAIPSDDGPASS